MKIFINTAVLLCLVISSAFAQGVNFEQGTWKEVVAKAQKENKIIFLDIYAVWCGPCKKMDKETFTDKSAGDFYNEKFINYKIDGEKGEGIDLAKQYKVTAYPTNIYIDAKTQSVITSEMGFCNAQEFIARGQSAINEFNDPMKWADYEKKFKSDNYDEAFIRQMISKGNRNGQNTDLQMDDLITKYMPTTPNEEYISFVARNVKTLDNKGVKFLVQYLVEQNAMMEMENWLPNFYEPTLEKAVATKNIAPLKEIETYATILNPTQASTIYNNYVTQYYYKINDKKNYWKSLDKEMSILMQKSDEAYKAEDQKALDEIIGQYKMQLAQYGIPEDQQGAQIDEALAQKPETKISVSFMAASQFNEVFGTLAKEKTIDKNIANQVETWGNKMTILVQTDPQYAAFFSVNYAKALHKINKKEKAKAVLNNALTQTSGNADLKKVIEEALETVK